MTAIEPGRAPGAKTVAVVVPAFDAAETLPACLAAIAASHRRPDEIIVYDDGSADATAALARAAGASVIGGEGRGLGPAVGRNIGARAAGADILLFVDADVVLAPDTVGLLADAVTERGVAAAFGSYDDRPPSRRAAAQYANLRHHWVHQQGRETAFTFWSGIGAIDRATFLAHGGFDTRYRTPSIEDVELGARIVEAGGRIALVKQAQGTHLKAWTVRQLWRTDIVRRAIPWARMMKRGIGKAADLNLSIRERASAVVAHLVWLGLAAALVRPALWPVPAIAAAGYVALNARFFAFLFRKAGFARGCAGIVLHWCYHLYASVTYAVITLLPGPPADEVTADAAERCVGVARVQR